MFLSRDGKEFQRRGADLLNALLPMVPRLAEGTESCVEEDDLRERDGLGTRIRSDRFGGARLWMDLNISRRILN